MSSPPVVTFVLGTRPEIIKCSPLFRVFEACGIPFEIVHTGQHYDEELDTVFFKQLNLPQPDYNLEVGSDSHGCQTGKMMTQLEPILSNNTPKIVLVQGDTNSVLAGSVTASKLNSDVDVGHIEAGLRSNQDDMPEEMNRRVSDHISDMLFAPTEHARSVLISEGIAKDSVFVTGNTIVDAVRHNLTIAVKESTVLEEHSLLDRNFAVLTLHRESNVDNGPRFGSLLNAVGTFASETGLAIIYPIHPRAKEAIAEFDINIRDNIKLIEPLNYFDFLQLQSESEVIFTDSGGVQEEACILEVPCITLREATERPETVEIGANVVISSTTDEIVEQGKKAMESPMSWENPFGDGESAEHILDVLRERYNI